MMARRGDTKPLCHIAHASVALPGVSLLPLSGVKSLVLCQEERAKGSQAPMRHAWSDRAYPGACGAVLASPACLAVPVRHGSGCSLGDRQRTASRPQPWGFALGCRGQAVRAHACRSHPCAPCSASDRDTPRCRSADVPPVRRGDVPCPRVCLLEVPGNEGIFPPRTLRTRDSPLALHHLKDLAHPVG